MTRDIGPPERQAAQTTANGAGPDPAVAALGRAVQRALRRIDAVDKNVLQLATDVAALAARLTADDKDEPAADAASDGVLAARSWLLADSPHFDARADLAQLMWWVERVYLRYSRARLSPCWLWHPEAIEELWWLRGAHADAYHPEDGSWLRVGDWHDRLRPGVERRLHGLLNMCSLSRHISRHGRPPEVGEPGPVPLAEHAEAISAAWTAHPRTAGPTPTDEQLTDADRYHNEWAR